MSRNKGIPARALGAAERTWGVISSTALVGVPFIVAQPTVAATSSYDVYSGNAPFKFRIIDWWIVMIGAGASSDTAKLTDGTNDITDAVDVSSAARYAIVAGGEIDDAYHEIAKNGTLNVTTASGALCIVYALCMKVE